MYSCASLAEARGCPIRIFTDQSLFAAPHDFSQRTTSFIASQCQGIHQMLLSRLMLSLPMSIVIGPQLIQKVLYTFWADGPSPTSADWTTNIRSKKDLYVLDLPAAERSSSCVPRQSAIPRNSPFRARPSACLAFGPCKQIPSFTMSISKTHAQCRAAKLVIRGLNGQMPENSNTAGNGGARRDRTDDLKLAKLPLSQLSYGPLFHPHELTHMIRSRPPGPSLNLVGLGRLELPTSRLSSARSNQLSYKPGTEGTKPRTKTHSHSVATSRERET